ncbi:tRNA 4-thiouridine synthase [Olavius algarvensis spirochete endosymbiont]|uniref:tRNA uracil 4-sulfurtransferase ThiI n=1 Tax=Olavius algarvensis spirochete endosymbiont TaxID=260710 RepID=UPI000F16431E|nr:tRNA uracil 4-sulfurtransferase ThiI [Olavius algarvensis spirochete endosymbiont]CAD7837439.1 MAG: tRNA 4-thiouridine synthase (EC 2.8.1.4) [Olavius algarvensis spirochete endosymbiont]VDB01042.1 tRNA 4-thiouridine synthase [Olavius algarvensis spirochete endosymbiont]
MKNLWLIKIGEIALKKGNRGFFERILERNIRKKLSEFSAEEEGGQQKNQLTKRTGRYYLETAIPDEQALKLLSRTPGVVGFARAYRIGKSLDELTKTSVFIARECLGAGIGTSFKIKVRRADKSLALDSQGYAAELGARVLSALPELSVDVHNPDFIIEVELREWAYVYQERMPGIGGLPVGSAGRGVLLLSGGIDSPVAGYLMAKRGMRLSAVHFHTPPFTSEEAHDKAVRLAGLIAPWCEGISLYSVPFTDCQVAINKGVDKSVTTLHSRAAMMQIAQRIFITSGKMSALITGESLGQVASQTLECLTYTNQSVSTPVFRPLISMDKEEIIALARKIGVYETAIEPFDDCCTLFSPEHPLTRPNPATELHNYGKIEGLTQLIEAAVEGAETISFDSWGRRCA